MRRKKTQCAGLTRSLTKICPKRKLVKFFAAQPCVICNQDMEATTIDPGNRRAIDRVFASTTSDEHKAGIIATLEKGGARGAMLYALNHPAVTDEFIEQLGRQISMSFLIICFNVILIASRQTDK